MEEPSLSSQVSGEPLTPHGVNESLEGLLGAFEHLKSTLGYGNELAAVEQHLLTLRSENEELRQFAEEAIRKAQLLKDANEALREAVEQQELEARVGKVLAETQRMRDISDDFQRDLLLQRLEEAEARAEEAGALRERVAELEEESAALTATLNEFRQSAQQMQRLQALQASVAATAAGAGAAAAAAAPRADVAAPLEPAVAAAPAAAVDARAAAVPAGSPPAAAALKAAAPATHAAAPPSAFPAAVVPAGQPGEALAIAEQLDVVAAGAAGGVAASAARLLRNHDTVSRGLQSAEAENAQLRREVEHLNETMVSKTFKAPSAWAEREVKYKQDKRAWEVAQKESAAALLVLQAELEAYRAAGKAPEFEGRIQELEAQLLQSERERDNARSQLHELQLTLRAEGEFGRDGREGPVTSPLRGGMAPSGPDSSSEASSPVRSMVTQMEHSRLGTEAPWVAAAAADAAVQETAAARAHRLEAENRGLREALATAQALAAEAAGQELVRMTLALTEPPLPGAEAQTPPPPGALEERGQPALNLATPDEGPIQLNLNLSGGDEGTPAAAGGAAALAGEEAMHGDGGGAPGLPEAGSGRGLSAAPSAEQLAYSPNRASELARDVAAAEAAYEDYAKRSDLPGLQRAKATLEARCAVLEAQIGKMQGALEAADHDKAAIQEQLDSAIKTGDVKGLAGLKEKLRQGSDYLGSKAGGARRMFKRPGSAGGTAAGAAAGGSPAKEEKLSKDQLKAALHESRDALQESEAERNLLRRQLAKLSKKYQQAAVQGAATAGYAFGHVAAAGNAAAAAAHASAAARGTSELSENGSAASEDVTPSMLGIDEDEAELLQLRGENAMMMEHLVMVKVRLAETEGGFLESRRALLRAQQHQMELARRLEEAKAALAASGGSGGAPALPVSQPSPAAAAVGASPPPPLGPASPAVVRQSSEEPTPEKRRGLRIPGL